MEPNIKDQSIYIYIYKTESQDNFPMLGSSVVYYVKHVMTLLLHENFYNQVFHSNYFKNYLRVFVHIWLDSLVCIPLTAKVSEGPVS